MKNRDCYKIVILLANFNKKYSYLNLEKCLRYALLKKNPLLLQFKIH